MKRLENKFKLLGSIFFIIFAFIEVKSQTVKSFETWNEHIYKTQVWFTKHDVNLDKKLSLEEFPKEAMKWWELANFNRDEFLSWEEEEKFQKGEYEKIFISNMRKTNQVCNFRKHLDGHRKPNLNKFQNVSGEWLLFATMLEDKGQGNGVMFLTLNQKKHKLSGELKQLATPGNEGIEFSVNANNQFIGKYGASVFGQFVQAEGDDPKCNLFFLRRKDKKSNFEAFFTGSIASDGRTIIAQLTNNLGFYGTMLMIKREAIFKLSKEEILLLTMQKY